MDDSKADPEPAAIEQEPCPICRRAWDAHNLPRARACYRTLEQAVAIAEQLLLSLSDPRPLPDNLLGVSR
jgi:hypothetical protein